MCTSMEELQQFADNLVGNTELVTHIQDDILPVLISKERVRKIR